ncbi:MAG: hypothetical protein WAO28_03760 [Candidatus Microsaccharimonas sp.]
MANPEHESEPISPRDAVGRIVDTDGNPLELKAQQIKTSIDGLHNEAAELEEAAQAALRIDDSAPFAYYEARRAAYGAADKEAIALWSAYQHFDKNRNSYHQVAIEEDAKRSVGVIPENETSTELELQESVEAELALARDGWKDLISGSKPSKAITDALENRDADGQPYYLATDVYKFTDLFRGIIDKAIEAVDEDDSEGVSLETKQIVAVMQGLIEYVKGADKKKDRALMLLAVSQTDSIGYQARDLFSLRHRYHKMTQSDDETLEQDSRDERTLNSLVLKRDDQYFEILR